MTASELIVWNKIQNFQLDDPQVDYKFSERVARENGWSKAYSNRVIDEYKKFIFLYYSSNTGITPSDPVDQVWHLHLTFTKSYWIDLCKKILDKELHHNPTKGGLNEANKFNDFYSNTLKRYFEIFNTPPPLDIWQSNEIRFSDIDFQRVNLRKYWLLKRPGNIFRKLGVTISLAFIAAIFIYASGVNPFIAIVVVAGIISIVAAIRNKGNGNNNDSSGCTTSGCGSDGGHHGHSGCGSGCSGCSGSGCSGCGGSSD